MSICYFNAEEKCSVFFFIGEAVTVPGDVGAAIGCGQLIDEVVSTTNVTNPTVTWYKDGAVLTTGSAPNVEISDDGRVCVIASSLLAVGGRFGTDVIYSCEVCCTLTNCKRNDSSITVCGE